MKIISNQLTLLLLTANLALFCASTGNAAALPRQVVKPAENLPAAGIRQRQPGQLESPQAQQKAASAKEKKNQKKVPHCSICLQVLIDDHNKLQVIRQLPECRHVFHEPCIAQWLSINQQCPLCRRAVQASPENQRFAAPPPARHEAPAMLAGPPGTICTSEGDRNAVIMASFWCIMATSWLLNKLYNK
jgi:hypothetical protein